MTGIYYHELFEKHLDGFPHIESPERYRVVMKRLKAGGFPGPIEFIEAPAARLEWIKAIHDERYVDGVLSLNTGDRPVVLDLGDTVATKYSLQAALHSAGAAVDAVSRVHRGELRSAFSAGRPPGHHAERDRAMGFCIFNNIAIAAAYLIAEEGVRRVAIIDWDIHHGNGTEHIFSDDPNVLYISLHQYPHYPGTGHRNSTGTGPGTGYTMNFPVDAGSGDGVYLGIFNERIVPALEEFDPGFILISAGFDAHAADPLSSGMLSSDTYGEMTRLLRGVADKCCGGRIVSLLEGGYDLDALAESVEKHVGALASDV